MTRPAISDEVLAEHHVLVDADNGFQRRARLLQALWREERGLPVGERRAGIPLGSRLPKEYAREDLPTSQHLEGRPRRSRSPFSPLRSSP